MGKYINPEDCTKEEFLKKHGIPITAIDMMRLEYEDDNFLCAHVDNGFFTAALICDCKYEMRYVKESSSSESRTIKYFLVEKRHLEPFLF